MFSLVAVQIAVRIGLAVWDRRKGVKIVHVPVARTPRNRAVMALPFVSMAISLGGVLAVSMSSLPTAIALLILGIATFGLYAYLK
jgi:hypothetical protein